MKELHEKMSALYDEQWAQYSMIRINIVGVRQNAIGLINLAKSLPGD